METPPVLIGRSSSHFTRLTRIFAHELDVPHRFEIVRDLMSVRPDEYGGNPALKLPILKTERGAWFGSLNICRELARRSTAQRRIVWPESLEVPLLANAQELATQAMATEVGLILSRLSGVPEENTHQAKMRTSLAHSLAWLDANWTGAIAALPPGRDLSFLEVTVFCLVTHLEFRNVLPTEPYPRLGSFCTAFAERPSAAATPYRFDVEGAPPS